MAADAAALEAKMEADANSAEARAHAVMTGQPNPTHEKLQAKQFFAHLIGRDNLEHPQLSKGDAYVAYYRMHGEERLRDFWAEALQQRDKPPRFHFFDLCKGAALPKIIQDKPARALQIGDPVIWSGDGQRHEITDTATGWFFLENGERVRAEALVKVA